MARAKVLIPLSIAQASVAKLGRKVPIMGCKEDAIPVRKASTFEYEGQMRFERVTIDPGVATGKPARNRSSSCCVAAQEVSRLKNRLSILISDLLLSP